MAHAKLIKQLLWVFILVFLLAIALFYCEEKSNNDDDNNSSNTPTPPPSQAKIVIRSEPDPVPYLMDKDGTITGVSNLLSRKPAVLEQQSRNGHMNSTAAMGLC